MSIVRRAQKARSFVTTHKNWDIAVTTRKVKLLDCVVLENLQRPGGLLFLQGKFPTCDLLLFCLCELSSGLKASSGYTAAEKSAGEHWKSSSFLEVQTTESFIGELN